MFWLSEMGAPVRLHGRLSSDRSTGLLRPYQVCNRRSQGLTVKLWFRGLVLAFGSWNEDR